MKYTRRKIMIEPEHTCPKIDQIIKENESIQSDTDKIIEIATSIDSIVANNNSEIEDLRAANEELREWGNYWKNKYEELEKEVEND
tara:strand:- start:359 stop:616 length:258 start_codon:yes stop_codon:yes gene_type:complete